MIEENQLDISPAMHEEEYYIDSMKTVIKTMKEQENWSMHTGKLVVDLADGYIKITEHEILTKMISRIKGVESIELHMFNCKLTDDHMKSLVDSILLNNIDSLKEVKMDLSDNTLTSSSLAHILHMINQLKSPRKMNIDLTNNMLNRGAISPAIPLSSPSIKFIRLVLEDSNASNNVLSYICSNLCNMKCMMTLVVNMYGCGVHIDDTTLQCVMDSSIRNMDLMVSQVDYSSVASLIRGAIPMRHKMSRMKIEMNRITNVDNNDMMMYINEEMGRYKHMDIESTSDGMQQDHLDLDNIDDIDLDNIDLMPHVEMSEGLLNGNKNKKDQQYTMIIRDSSILAETKKSMNTLYKCNQIQLDIR